MLLLQHELVLASTNTNTWRLKLRDRSEKELRVKFSQAIITCMTAFGGATWPKLQPMTFWICMENIQNCEQRAQIPWRKADLKAKQYIQ
jgi:hypothetical protein